MIQFNLFWHWRTAFDTGGLRAWISLINLSNLWPLPQADICDKSVVRLRDVLWRPFRRNGRAARWWTPKTQEKYSCRGWKLKFSKTVVLAFGSVVLSYLEAEISDVNETLWSENDTFGFQTETRPRPRPSTFPQDLNRIEPFIFTSETRSRPFSRHSFWHFYIFVIWLFKVPIYATATLLAHEILACDVIDLCWYVCQTNLSINVKNTCTWRIYSLKLVNTLYIGIQMKCTVFANLLEQVKRLIQVHWLLITLFSIV